MQKKGKILFIIPNALHAIRIARIFFNISKLLRCHKTLNDLKIKIKNSFMRSEHAQNDKSAE